MEESQVGEEGPENKNRLTTWSYEGSKLKTRNIFSPTWTPRSSLWTVCGNGSQLSQESPNDSVLLFANLLYDRGLTAVRNTSVVQIGKEKTWGHMRCLFPHLKAYFCGGRTRIILWAAAIAQSWPQSRRGQGGSQPPRVRP